MAEMRRKIHLHISTFSIFPYLSFVTYIDLVRRMLQNMLMRNKQLPLADQPIHIRIKLSALWVAVMFCYIYGDYFELYVPQKLDGLLSGKNMLDSPGKLLIATILLTLPALLIFLSLLLKPSIVKWLNIAVGLFFTIFTLLVGLSSLSAWRMFYVFLSLLESVLTLVIVIVALGWNRKIIDNR